MSGDEHAGELWPSPSELQSSSSELQPRVHDVTCMELATDGEAVTVGDNGEGGDRRCFEVGRTRSSKAAAPLLLFFRCPHEICFREERSQHESQT